ncbi:MAG TPA: MoaD/ThiS family protein [Candidatus Tectomicrobia bacterium]|nr:MoaD/ThiS family protein [Candidatus Tectomicrobia bacterium]
MKVVLRNPRREVDVAGNRRVKDVLRDLAILPETVLIIRGDELITADQVVAETDVIELRPVMSGGAGAHAPVACRGTGSRDAVPAEASR